jgi:2-methylisocitrate lyase-like PEP mutase family enzyme
LARIPRELPDHPLLVNIVEGGKTPQLSAGELSNLGYRFVLHANLLLRVTARAAQEALAHLRAHGSSAGLLDRVMDWEERQELVGLPGLDELEDDITRSAQDRPRQS